MLIRLALWMILLCLPLFLLAKALLIFTFVVFATLATKFAVFLLLAAFGLLILMGIVGVWKRSFEFVRDYFSAPQREKRHLLFVENQKRDRHRLFYFQRLQLDYFKERQRRRLLEKNNRDQINALSDSIERQLVGLKQQLSKDLFSQFQLENRRYRKQQNEQALLKLHAKLTTFAGQ